MLLESLNYGKLLALTLKGHVDNNKHPGNLNIDIEFKKETSQICQYLVLHLLWFSKSIYTTPEFGFITVLSPEDFSYNPRSVAMGITVGVSMLYCNKRGGIQTREHLVFLPHYGDAPNESSLVRMYFERDPYSSLHRSGNME